LIENLNNEEPIKLPSKQRQADVIQRTKYPKEMQRVDFVDYVCKKDDSEI
jgi:hypothetical protein